MSDPKYNKAAPVRVYALTADGVEVPLRADENGNLVLAATIDTSNLALHADVDGVETLITSTNTKLDTVIGHVDGLEGKLDTLHTDVGTTLHADVDGLETLVTATNAALELLKLPTTFTAITPSDSTNVTSTCTKGIMVTVAGVVNVTGVGGSAVGLGTLPAGTVVPVALSRVNVATTATVVGLSGP